LRRSPSSTTAARSMIILGVCATTLMPTAIIATRRATVRA
jgi:hypothetical protein